MQSASSFTSAFHVALRQSPIAVGHAGDMGERCLATGSKCAVMDATPWLMIDGVYESCWDMSRDR